MAAVEDRQQKDEGGKMFEEDIYLFSFLLNKCDDVICQIYSSRDL